MITEEDLKRQAQQDAFHRELERRSLDVFMVYNPTDEDYLLEWDKRYFRIPNKNKNAGFGKGKMELERYLAEKYALEMKDKLINEMASEEGQEMLARRRREGHPDFKDKYVENQEVWNRVIKTDNPMMIEKIYKDVILGLVREFGLDYVPEQRGEERDTRTPEQRTFEQMNKRYVPEEERVVEIKPIKGKGKVNLEEVTNDTP